MAAIYKSKKKLTIGDLVLILIGIGIIGGIVLAVLTPIVKNSKYRQTVAKINEARESIIEFALKEKRLPTPAEFSTISMNVDAWGGTFIYVPDHSFTSQGIFCCSSPSGILVKDRGEDVPDVAFIIISEGKNGVNDSGKGLLFSIKEMTEEYDDITSYMKISELLERAGCAPLMIENETLPVAAEDIFYSTKLIVRSGCSDMENITYKWSVTEGELPPGLVVGGDGALAGTINVSPEQKGTLEVCIAEFPFKIEVSGAGGLPAKKEFVLKVVPWRLRILKQNMPSAFPGKEYSFTPEAKGGRNEYVWGISSGLLPPGLNLNQKTGTIAGKPATGSVGTYAFTLSLSDGCNETKWESTLQVGSCPPMRVLPPSPLTAVAGKNLSQTLVIEGGSPPYTLSADGCVNNCEEMGVQLKCLETGAVLSGKPRDEGSCTFSVKWLDSCPSGSQILRQDYILNILEGSSDTVPVPARGPGSE